jgi:hypothetical protein
MLRVMAESINVGFADVLNRAADVQHAHVHLAPQRKSNRAQLPEGVQWIADDLVALWLGPAASAQAQAVAALAAFAAIFRLCFGHRLPLHVGRRIVAAALQRNDVIDDVPGAGAGRLAGRRTGVFALELAAGGGAALDAGGG